MSLTQTLHHLFIHHHAALPHRPFDRLLHTEVPCLHWYNQRGGRKRTFLLSNFYALPLMRTCSPVNGVPQGQGGDLPPPWPLPRSVSADACRVGAGLGQLSRALATTLNSWWNL